MVASIDDGSAGSVGACVTFKSCRTASGFAWVAAWMAGTYTFVKPSMTSAGTLIGLPGMTPGKK